jgi:ribonuclease Z
MCWTPLRIIGPSGRRPEFGTETMVEAMQQMCRWPVPSLMTLLVGDGYQTKVTDF